MIDPSINLRRMLKDYEEALWGARVSEETLAEARRRSIRGTGFFLCFLVLILIYTIYQNRGPLFRGESVGPVSPTIFLLVFLMFAAGLTWVIGYSLRSLKADLAEEKPSIYLITTKRLVATDASYNPLGSMNVEEIGHVFTMGSDQEELIVNRKNDPNLDSAFYITDVPDLAAVKSIIEELIPKRA